MRNLLPALALVASLAACEPAPRNVIKPFEAFVEADEIAVSGFGQALLEINGAEVQARRSGSGAMGITIVQGAGALADASYSAPFTVEADAHAVLRLTRSDGTRDYLPLTTERFRLDGDTIEALIYSETAERIHVRFGDVTDCRTGEPWYCFTFDQLRQEIFPDGEPADSREKLLAILDWVSNNADMTDDRAIMQRATAWMATSASAEAVYAGIYKTDRAGGYCGATALFMATLLRQFGYDALTLDFGDVASHATHVTTLVYNPFGQGQFYILDPTFNFYLTRADGEWASLDDALRHDVTIVTRSVEGRDTLRLASNSLARVQTCRPGGDPDIVACHDPGDTLDRYFATQAPAMRALGLSGDRSDMLRLLRMRTYGVGLGSAEAQSALREVLQSAGVPGG